MAERLTEIAVIRDNRSFGDYKPGEMGKPFQKEPDTWYMCCPGCGLRAGLPDHGITENSDGTVTISPSLVCPHVDTGKCTAHYFVEQNKIRWC